MKKVITGIVLLVMLAIIATGCGGGQAANNLEKWKTTKDITQATVKAALNGDAPANPTSVDVDFPNNITKIEVKSSKIGNDISIYFKNNGAWDETDFVKTAGGTEIKAASILFANPSVQSVTIYDQTEMTDTYGKKSVETGVEIMLGRNMANKADWNGLAELHTTDPGNIYRLAEYYYIHPAILKNVKQDVIKLQVPGQ